MLATATVNTSITASASNIRAESTRFGHSAMRNILWSYPHMWITVGPIIVS